MYPDKVSLGQLETMEVEPIPEVEEIPELEGNWTGGFPNDAEGETSAADVDDFAEDSGDME